MSEENKSQSVFGIIGLGTMGSNLLQNIADNGFLCSGYDINAKAVHALNQLQPNNIHGFLELSEFVKSLKSPKVIMLLVPAGKIVDHVLEELMEVLEKGDIIIDGGNSHFTDTERRFTYLNEKDISFIGMGVSGGEKGARRGPSMMPGGNKNAYETVKPILTKIVASVNGEPTVAYMGVRSAGHFVKMVHNGIEYAIMQLLSEVYSLLKNGLQFNDTQIQEVFKKWNEGRLKSYLIEITQDIFVYKKKGEDHILLNDIKDQAKSKGTGKWTSQVAMDLNLPIPIIDIAVSMRDLSKYKDLRIKASKTYPNSTDVKFKDTGEKYLSHMEETFYFAMVSAYAQGMHLLAKANEEYKYELNLRTIAKIWRAGCIIRSEFLEAIYEAYSKDSKLEHLFLDANISKNLVNSVLSSRIVVSDAIRHGVALPAISAALAYFDNFRKANMPTNLIQAQRDYFGSHTYEIEGEEGVFHTEWESDND